ncbi:MAG: hypothetical protein JSW25_07840 [Thermoplasmata archaeon]|nr:MAG: hypothetical protein JSW25_07840 [Thermoplasmata archaeon]
MTLLAIESFGYLPDGAITASDLVSNIWLSSNGGTVTDLGLSDGRKKWTPTGIPRSTKMALGGDYTTILVGMRIHSNVSASQHLLEFIDNGAGVLGLVEFNSAGQLEYHADTTDGNLKLTSTGSTGSGNDDYWVIKVVFHATAGEVYFYKNGVLDASVTGVDTIYAGTACDQIDFGGGETGTSGNWAISDVWVDDSVNHGDVYVNYEPCNLSGSSDDWVATGDTNNEDCVDEIGPDGDTTFTKSFTVGDLDQLKCSGTILLSGGSIIAVAPFVRARKESASGDTFKLGLKSGSNHGQGSDIGPATTYQNFFSLFNDVPGGSGWSVSEYENCEVSYEKTA